MLAELQTGAVSVSGSSKTVARAGQQGDLIASLLHGRYYEQNYRGNVYMDGMGLTSISNTIWTTGTTDATSKGIVGIWNPTNSGVNAVVLQVFLGVTMTAATNTGGAPYVYTKAVSEAAITTGTTPTNCKTLAASGSVVKGMSGIAMTGKVNALTVLRAANLSGGSSANFSFVGTAVGQATPFSTSIEIVDGLIIVPPGGILALQATTTPVAHSAASGIVWEEVPV
jgi:hypothetical protein